MKQFLETGSFGPIRLGMTIDEVISIVGEPDDITSPRRSGLTVITYGRIELYFGYYDDKKLQSISSNYYGEIDGGALLQIDPWIFCGRLTHDVVADALREAGIKFIKTDPNINSFAFITNAGSTLTFYLPSDPEQDRPWFCHFSVTVVSDIPDNSKSKVPAFKQISITLTREDYECLRHMSEKQRIKIGEIGSRLISEGLQNLREQSKSASVTGANPSDFSDHSDNEPPDTLP
jgi:hypothetical protein